jgi:hypothetical protein
MPTSNDYYSNYPEACEVVIPISLKVPVMLQAEVISKPPVCHTHNGYEEYSQPEEEYKTEEEKQEQPA